jgi:hypothetical protein
MTQEKDIQTGSARLDEDLRDLFETCDSERLAIVKEAIADKNISPEKLGELVPTAIIRLSSLFLSDLSFSQFLQRRSEQSRALLQEARSLFVKHFAGMVDNEAAMSILKKEGSDAAPDEESLTDKSIAGVSHIAAWLGTPPELVPAVRIGFKDRRGKILLDITEDWEDISYLVAALTAVLKRLLEEGRPLAESKQIDLEYAGRVGKHLRKTKEALAQLEELAPAFSIQMQNSDDGGMRDSGSK